MRKITIKCPTCNNELNLELLEYVNATHNEELKRRVMMKRVFEVRCPKCHGMHFINHPFLYQDDEKKLLVVLANSTMDLDRFVKKQGLKGNFKRDYTLRVVYDLNSLVEKVILSQYDVSDKLMEVVKMFYYMSQNNADIDHLYFEGIEFGKIRLGVLLKNGRQVTTYVDKSAVERIEKINKRDLYCSSSSWEKVDDVWATNFYKNNLAKINEIETEVNKEANLRKEKLSTTIKNNAEIFKKEASVKKKTTTKPKKEEKVKVTTKKETVKKDAKKATAKKETVKKETKKVVDKVTTKAGAKKKTNKEVAEKEAKKTTAKKEAKKVVGKEAIKTETKKSSKKETKSVKKDVSTKKTKSK